MSRLNDKRASENLVFLGLVFVIFVSGFYTFIKNQRATSTIENRHLAQFEHFTLKDFIDGVFQDNFDSAMSDQFPMSQKIRAAYGELIGKLPMYGIDSAICLNRYLILSGGADGVERSIYDCEDYFVVTPAKQVGDLVWENIEKYNHMNKINDVYYYYIRSSNSYDFAKDEGTVDYASILSRNLKGNYHLAELGMNGWEDYKKYFYKTDHHWNYTGSYQGFLDIARMLGVDKPSEPIGTFTSQEYFFGSHARIMRNYSILENFTIYTFNIPDHDTTINGVQKKYNHISEFINHDYEYSKNRNFYGEVYGMDYGEITFDFHQPTRPNLLIVSNSYSNAINELIAQYFNKTYVVDLRYYERQNGEAFKYSEYIKEKRINKTLVIADLSFLVSASLNQGLEL